jgi:hypothetical protein
MIRKYDKKYLNAQKNYLKDFPPLKAANMRIDNANWEYPRRL